MADSSTAEPSRATNALFKRKEQLERWKQSETAREPVFKPTKRNKLKFDDGTVFLSAVSAGDLDEVKRLLQKGCDVNYQNVDGVTALHQACIDENDELVELLVQHKANLEIRDNEGWSALHAAASSGNLDVTEFLVQHGADIAAVNNEGELPLDLAEEDEMEEYLQDQLRKANIDVEAARAEEERIMEEDAQSWLNKGEISEVKDKTGATALHVAAAKEYTKVISLLLQAGSDPNAQDVDEWTPLHAAAHWGQKEACKLLADYGADFTLRNHVGLTPIDLAEPDMEKFLEELKKKQMEKPKINAIAPSLKILDPGGHPPLARRRSITRIKDAGLSKTDVTLERKTLADSKAVQKEPFIEESKQEAEEKQSSSSAESDSEESDDSEESSGEESEEKENQRRKVSEKLAMKRGSESDSESEKNNRVSNVGKNQPVTNNIRGRNPAFSQFDNKNAVSTTTTTNTVTSRVLNSTSRIYPNRQTLATEKKEEPGTRYSERFGLNRGKLATSRSEDGEAEKASRDIDSRRKLFERTRPVTSSYLSRLTNEDSRDTRGQEEVKDRVESKTNGDNTRNTKDEETRPNFRSQLRETKISSYQPRTRPTSRNYDDDKSKHNDVDSYLSRRNNITGRSSIFSDRDKDRNDTTTTTSSYTSRRSRLRDDADTSSTTRDTTSSRTTSNYLRSGSAENVSSRFSEREKERERQRELEKEKENEKRSEKEKAKEKETEKESVDKSAASSAARARKNRRPREKRRSTGVAYMPSESDEEEPDELQEAKKNTMMNEDIEEKEKSKEETRSLADRIRAGRTASSTFTTDRHRNTSRASDSKMPTDVNTLQEKLRETQTELDETKTKLEKTLQDKNKLERKLENMEEELKQLNDLREDNQRLKDENGALIRVISKLSRTPT